MLELGGWSLVCISSIACISAISNPPFLLLPIGQTGEKNNLIVKFIQDILSGPARVFDRLEEFARLLEIVTLSFLGLVY